MDRAIDLAVQMLVDRDERMEVMEVGSLSHGTTQADAIGPVTNLLEANGMGTVPEIAGDEERFVLLREAFVHGGVPIEQFEGLWYGRLSASSA